MQNDNSKLKIILLGILVLLVVSGWFVSRLSFGRKGGGEGEQEVLEIGKPEISAIPEADGYGITLKLSELKNVDKVDIVLTYDWRGRPEQYVVSDFLSKGQEAYSALIRFESCSGEDCIYHDVERGKIKLTLTNRTGGEWGEEFEFEMGEGEVILERG